MNFYRKRTWERVQQAWGREMEEIPFAQLEKNFVSMMRREDWILDDQTWNDLEMNSVYQKLNRTYSDPGQQCLYNMLRIQQFNREELQRRDRLITFFQMNPEERNTVNCVLDSINKEVRSQGGNRSEDSNPSREFPDYDKAKASKDPAVQKDLQYIDALYDCVSGVTVEADALGLTTTFGTADKLYKEIYGEAASEERDSWIYINCPTSIPYSIIDCRQLTIFDY